MSDEQEAPAIEYGWAIGQLFPTAPEEEGGEEGWVLKIVNFTNKEAEAKMAPIPPFHLTRIVDAACFLVVCDATVVGWSRDLTLLGEVTMQAGTLGSSVTILGLDEVPELVEEGIEEFVRADEEPASDEAASGGGTDG